MITFRLPGIRGTIRVSSARTERWIRRTYRDAHRGVASAQWHLAAQLQSSFWAGMIPADDRAALSWFRRAAERGQPGAWSSVAGMYAEGHGVARDEKKAFEIVLADACRGDLIARMFLGRYYCSGIGVKRDRRHGLRLLEEAVALGEPFAARDVAECYRHGCGVRKSVATAAYWLSIAAFAETSVAAYELALLFENGHGVRRSPRDAFYFMTLAVEFADTDAHHSLGWYYDNGFGCRRDETKAIRYYSFGAWKNAASARNLARIYAKGSKTTPRDLDRACGYLDRAFQLDEIGTLSQVRRSPELRALMAT